MKVSFRDPHAKSRDLRLQAKTYNQYALPIAIPNDRIHERYKDKALPMLKKFYDSFQLIF